MELPNPELSIVLTDNPHIRQLNEQWRGEDKATDVLSFPLFEADEIPDEIFALGDIVISIEFADSLVQTQTHQSRIATELNIPVEQLTWTIFHEVTFLVIHSLLHLIGYDHADTNDELEMKSKEIELWSAVVDAI